MVVSYDLCIFYLFQNGGEFSKWTMGQKLFWASFLLGFVFDMCILHILMAIDIKLGFNKMQCN